MNLSVEPIPAQPEHGLVDDTAQALVSFDLITALVNQYNHAKAEIKRVSEFMCGGKHIDTLSYFFDGNMTGLRVSLSSLFELQGAIGALNSEYWKRVLARTDILETMPAVRRAEWNSLITKHQCPEFEEGIVRNTIKTLGDARKDYIGERVDGVFRKLSPDHVTNLPWGFTKRFIIAGVMGMNGYSNPGLAEYISDLRQVIAKITKRDSANEVGTSALLELIYRTRIGEWVPIDGWAIRLKLFLKGTIHVEVHEDIAWRLNEILAHVHPRSIPSRLRQPSKRVRPPAFIPLVEKPLAFAVLLHLDHYCKDRRFGRKREFYLGGSGQNPAVVKQAIQALVAIGGVETPGQCVEFDYDPAKAIDSIILTGCVPEHTSHQFYGTQETLGEIAFELAEVEDHHSLCEPSAGQGGLAKFMPADRTTCVEISKLHCTILESKGYKTIHADFLEWAVSAPNFDRVIMNPPFSAGRALAHLVAASSLLARDGILVAILPASLKGKDLLPGWNLEWSRVFANEFAGTSASVTVLKAWR